MFAFDLDGRRLATMNTQLLKAGVLCVKAINEDILKTCTTDPAYAKVEYIMVDPSCSGSGIDYILFLHVDKPSRYVNTGIFYM